MLTTEKLAGILRNVSEIATPLWNDLSPVVKKTAQERERFGRNLINLEELCFWYKNHVRTFLANVAGLSYVLRQMTVAFAAEAGLAISEKRLREMAEEDHALPLDKGIRLALREFPRLFGVDFSLDTNGEDYRGFRELLRCRERFTHPKSPKDIYPIEIFPTASASVEWFLVTWRSVLVKCSTALKVPRDHFGRVARSFKYRESQLRRFQEIEQDDDAEPRKSPFIADLEKIIFGLMADTGRALTLVTASLSDSAGITTNWAIRNLGATLFSEIEGSLFIAASHLHVFGNDLAPEKSLLTGGHHEVRERIVGILEKFSDRFGSASRIAKDGSGWESFTICREMRNRLTHPKSPEDLLVRSGELDALLQLLSWWHGEAHRCFELEGSKLPHLAPF